VLAGAEATGDERSQAFAMWSAAFSSADTLKVKDPCLREARGYVAGFLYVMQSASVMDRLTIIELHRAFVSTAQSRIDRCEQALESFAPFLL
jgi:hypothetical protein